ncbi:MAG: winged helix-turn-helix domain-containing protein [Blastocatellia bacterium]|nr:winged helix-turn-helix domain-containing protein [Blastocatellia bacterium]
MLNHVDKENGLTADFRVGQWLVQPQLNRITIGDKTIQIEPKVMRVLLCLAERPEQVVTREQLMKTVWGNVFVSEQVLSRSISELRKVFDDDSKTQSFIETIPKTGYRLIAPVSCEETDGAPLAAIDDKSPVTEPPSSQQTETVLPQWRERNTFRAAALAILVVSAIVLGWFSIRSTSKESRSVMRLTLALPESLPPELELFQSLALSPDGRRLVYVARNEGRYQLYERWLDQPNPAPIPGTEGGYGPFFSPDGQWLGFYSGGSLKKVALDGGTPVTIASCCTDALGAHWGPDGTIVFARRFFDGLSRVPASGGRPEELTRLDLDRGERSHFWPEILPGGKAVIFTIWRGGDMDDAEIAVLSLETGERRSLFKGTCARYLSTGHLVYVRRGRLVAVPFDTEKLETTGPPAPSLEKVAMSYVSGAANYSISSDGTLVYLPGGTRQSDSSLLWVSRQGEAQAMVEGQRNYWNLRISPDGRRLALSIQGDSADLWTYELSDGSFKRLTFEKANLAPIWTPDGRRIVFTSDLNGPPLNLYWKAADGSDTAEQLVKSKNIQVPGSWSPDGKVLAYWEFDPSTRADLWILPLDGPDARKPRPFLRTDYDENQPMFSPDGRWIAYTSKETGRWEVFVRPFPGPGGKWQISTEGGMDPVWSRSGKELFYREGNFVMAVDIESGSTFKAAKPRLLLDGAYRVEAGTLLPSYDIAPDGQRFVMLKNETESTATELNVVLGWFEDLKRRLPPM